jgi:hypothetical protein
VTIKKIRPYAHDYSWNDATIVTKINSFRNELFNLKLEKHSILTRKVWIKEMFDDTKGVIKRSYCLIIALD